MAATLTAGTYATPVTRQVHEGVYAQYLKYEANGTSMSAGDIILMGYIPQGSTVLDVIIWGSWSSGASTIKVGSQTSISALGTTTTITAAGVNHMVGFVPRRFSLSSDAEGNLRVPIAAKIVAGTSTVTGSLNILLIMSESPAI